MTHLQLVKILVDVLDIDGDQLRVVVRIDVIYHEIL